MIRSMTGYGHAQSTNSGFSISLEIKSVNHRFFEFSARIPRAYGFLDEKLKSFFQARISRGKVECFVQIDTSEQENTEVVLNRSLAAGYIKAFGELAESFNLENDLTVSTLARYGDLFTVRKGQEDEDGIWQAVKTVAEQAYEGFLNMRQNEGATLMEDILFRAAEIKKSVEFIETRSPQTVSEYNRRLFERMKELLNDTSIDEQRILFEAAVFADKVAVAEETVRLRSHLAQLEEFTRSKEAVGRKMDFLVQEINREANTIGSKAQDTEIAGKVVSMKAEIEKIREQVQNIE